MAHFLLSPGSLGARFARSWKGISSARPKSILLLQDTGGSRRACSGQAPLPIHTCVAAVIAGL